MRAITAHGIALLLAAGLAAGPAAAQPAGEDPEAEASAAFDMGMRLFGEQNWAGALAAFDRAYSLQPHYAVLFNTGACLKELHRYPEALDAFERYLAAGGDEVRPERRAEAERLIAELRGFLSTVRVAVDVAGAEIHVDGRRHGTSPLAEPLVLGAGHHVIEARAAGYRDAREEFDIAGGEERDLELVLEALGSPTPTPTPTGGEAWYEDWVGWTLAGVGAASLGVGGYFLWNASDLESQGDAAADLSVADGHFRDAETSWLAGGVLAGVGAAALVAGAVLLALTPDAGETAPDEADGPATAVLPLVGPNALGLTVVF